MPTSFSLALAMGVAFVAVACGDSDADSEAKAAGDPIDTSTATRIQVAKGYCGGAPGQCYGQQSFTVELATGALEETGCSAGDASAAPVKRTLSAAELDRVRDALSGIRVAREDHLTYDGAMFALTVTSPSGTADYSPEAACGHDRFTKIVAGWPALWETMTKL